MAPPRTCECGDCQRCKRRDYMREYFRLHAEKNRQRVRNYRAQNIEMVRARERARNRRPVEHQRATNAVKHELKMGRMERPDVCSSCNESPPPAVDGRAQIEAHHEDYSKPLEVIWLCKACHMKRHHLVAA